MVLRVLHLVGSPLSEFFADLSRLYASDCLEVTADPELYEFHIAYVSPDGSWQFPADLSAKELLRSPRMDLSRAIECLTALQLDAVVPQMFCLPGMTAFRALFDVLGVPYLGNTANVMALGADKAKARAVVAAAGVPVPCGQVLRRGDVLTLTLPVVVKPVTGDNSLGVSKVDDMSECEQALASAFAYGDEVLAESYVELGREVRCGLIVRDGEIVGLPLEEYSVDSVTKPIRDHADKIGRGEGGQLHLVAKDPEHAWIVDPKDPVTQRVWEVAKRAHLALGCRQYSLFDFRIDPHGQPWFLEAGLYCSFARTSVIAVMAGAAGVSVPALFETMLKEALSVGGQAGERPTKELGGKD